MSWYTFNWHQGIIKNYVKTLNLCYEHAKLYFDVFKETSDNCWLYIKMYRPEYWHQEIQDIRFDYVRGELLLKMKKPPIGMFYGWCDG